MKIAKALKLKNQLAGDIAQLKDLLAKQNVRSTKQKFDYDSRPKLLRTCFPLDGVVSLHAGLKSRRCRRNPDSSGQPKHLPPLSYENHISRNPTIHSSICARRAPFRLRQELD